jgi:excisionase family DNA binding protein
VPAAKSKSANLTRAVAPKTVSAGLPAKQNEVLTLAEAAAYLRVGEAAILQAIRDQGLPARQLGTDWRFLRSALRDWLRVRRNHGLLAQLGAASEDPYLEEMLTEIYQGRGRPETEEG